MAVRKKRSASKKTGARKRVRRSAPKPAPEANGKHEHGGPKALWSGTISFGLVSVPVELFPASRTSGVPLRMLAPDGTPLNRRYVCSEDGRDLEADELVHAFELEDGEHVELSEDELEAAAPRKSRDIDLRVFVDVQELNPMTFEKAYVLTPSGDSSKPYRLLVEAMERQDKAGIATFVMRAKEYLAAILAHEGILWAQTLRFANELRSPEQVGLPEPAAKVPKKDVAGFERAIRALAREELDPKALAEGRLARLRTLVEQKRSQGEDVLEVPVGEDEEAEELATDPETRPDIFEVIRGRLAATPEKRARSMAPGRAARRKGPRRSGTARVQS